MPLEQILQQVKQSAQTEHAFILYSVDSRVAKKKKWDVNKLPLQ